MTVPVPLWLAIPGALLALVGASAIAGAILHKTPAPGHPPVPGPAPVPGPFSPDRPPSVPTRRPAPAPARHGGLDYAIAKDRCGRIRIWPGDGTVVHARRCGCVHVDLSDERIARFIAGELCPGCGRPSGIWCDPACDYAKGDG